MNAIYSFKPAISELGEYVHYKPINDNFFELARLSISSVSKFYKTFLYTDSKTAKLFEEHGLVFDNVVILNSIENTRIQNYALPKIYAMLEQKEPFVMFDFDTVIGEKLESDMDITYAYYEVDLTETFDPNILSYVQDSYVKPFHDKFINYYDTLFVDNFDWRRYPNFCALMVNNVDLIKECYWDLLKRVPIDIIENTPPTLSEQFLLHQHVISKKKSYGTFIDHATHTHIFKKQKLYHISINDENYHDFIETIQNLIK